MMKEEGADDGWGKALVSEGLSVAGSECGVQPSWLDRVPAD
ncbi:hypothetical protein ART_4007 [Arthrobacter sp. PAMC 25486]|nr:hypothetical protein ART_4007 [Arthrobacter sp. PAMC 25486]